MSGPRSSSAEIDAIQSLLARLYTQRLPYALKLNARVGRGERMTETDSRFLQTLFDEVIEAGQLTRRYPRYHGLVTQITSLYGEIWSKGVRDQARCSGDGLRGRSC